jgi:hypothetical protein
MRRCGYLLDRLLFLVQHFLRLASGEILERTDDVVISSQHGTEYWAN